MFHKIIIDIIHVVAPGRWGRALINTFAKPRGFGIID
jgi:hypothetical protein